MSSSISIGGAQYELMKYNAGVDTMISTLRNKYWITSVKTLAKRVVRRCFKCQRVDKRPLNQTPAPLPKDRLSQTPPFNVIGMQSVPNRPGVALLEPVFKFGFVYSWIEFILFIFIFCTVWRHHLYMPLVLIPIYF